LTRVDRGTTVGEAPHHTWEHDMSFGDKVEHKAEEAKGQAKEGYGTATGDPDLRAEGRADQDEANVKQAGDKVKDAAHDVKDALS
jgi:uncharacterized protein YjbJ (UPF0337 family)